MKAMKEQEQETNKQGPELEDPNQCVWEDPENGRCRFKRASRGLCSIHYHNCWSLVKDQTKPNITWEWLVNKGMALPRRRRTGYRSSVTSRIVALADQEKTKVRLAKLKQVNKVNRNRNTKRKPGPSDTSSMSTRGPAATQTQAKPRQTKEKLSNA